MPEDQQPAHDQPPAREPNWIDRMIERGEGKRVTLGEGNTLAVFVSSRQLAYVKRVFGEAEQPDAGETARGSRPRAEQPPG